VLGSTSGTSGTGTSREGECLLTRRKRAA